MMTFSKNEKLEIEFRTWNKKKKEYFRISKLWNGDTDPSCFSADGWVDNYGNCGNMKDIVVEQYTGLHDCNGKKVYDGDIDLVGPETYGKVVLKIGGFWITWSGREKPLETFLMPEMDNMMNIVGNIHENADLLEDKNEN